MSDTISTKPVAVIIGAGQAGGELATALRQQAYAGRIVLIGDEPQVPYRRPPLSKAFLSGDVEEASLYLKPAETYSKNGIECLTGTGVESIDRHAHSLKLYDGSELHYDKLALTTGGRPRRLLLPGAEQPNVHYIRTIADIARLRPDFQPGKRLLIIGGGYIGLEAAAVGIKCGLRVSVIEALPRVLARVTAPEISRFYEQVHRAHGVDLLTGVGVHALHGDTRVEVVELADGRRIEADLLIVGIGLIPNTELAVAAGIEVSNGIVVNRQCLTSDPDIVAAGDCTFHDNGFLGRRLRLESVSNAIDQARVAAATLCGKPADYASAPWFWSDQYDLKLQMVGLSQGYEQLIIRGDPAAQSFIAFYLAGGTVISADSVNRPQDFVLAKRLVAERTEADPAALADESIPLKSLLVARA